MPFTLPRRPGALVLLLSVSVTLGAVAFGTTGLAATPTELVSKRVASYSITPPKLFWHTGSRCLAGPDSDPVGEGSEDIRRVAAFGGPSRLIFSRGRPRSPELCREPGILSEIVADERHVYWVDGEGLLRFPTAASKSDAPEILSAQFHANETQGRIELAQNSDSLFTIIPSARGGTKVWQVRKDDGITTLLATVSGRNQDLQVDGRFIYWIRDGQLQRLDVVAQGSPVTLASDVSGYFPEGRRSLAFVPRGGGRGDGAGRIALLFTDYVFIGQGAKIVRYDNEKEQLVGTIYRSAPTRSS